MKIIALLDIPIPSGGGFNQALNAIIQMKRICENRFEFSVITTVPENLGLLKSIGIDAVFFKVKLGDKLFFLLMSNSVFKIVQSRIKGKWLSPIERKLRAKGADMIYFVTPSAHALNLQFLNFIFTVWDNCYRDTPEFPEVRQFGMFHDRERLYQCALPPAFLVLTDSPLLADNIARRYGIDRVRLLPMPFSPSPTLDSKSSISIEVTLKKYKIEQGYFFYPAQFWSHKNHIRILEALLILRKSGEYPIVVFAGGDQGNRKVIEHFIQANDLQSQVRFLGFVPADEMHGLYEGCCAVVMPTYFGPTNIPPLEAWIIGKPLIYSTHLKEQTQDAAMLVDPDDADELAAAMHSCFDENIWKELVRRGHERLKEIQKDREKAEKEILARLIQFEKRIRCWKS